MNIDTTSRPGSRPWLAALVAALLSTLAATFLVTPANASSGPILTLQRTRCYHSAGVGTAQVPAPGLQPKPYVNNDPNVVVIGDDSQRVTYRPYLMRWNGTAWRIVQYGPVFTGRTGKLYDTWDRAGGLWTVRFTIDPQAKKYYKFGAQIWWLADAHHAAGYASGAGQHLQWLAGAWKWTPYCTF